MFDTNTKTQLKMENIINLGIPHIGEQIFKNIETDYLLQCRKVSETWKVLAENVLLKRWKGKMIKACETGKEEIVKLLLENYNTEEIGLDVDHKNLAFMLACNRGHTDVVKVLLEYAEGNFNFNEDFFGYDCLFWAGTMEHKDVIKLLLTHSDDLRQTIFMQSCITNRMYREKVVKLLLEVLDESELHIDLNAKDDQGKTALINACLNDFDDLVQWMLEH